MVIANFLFVQIAVLILLTFADPSVEETNSGPLEQQRPHQGHLGAHSCFQGSDLENRKNDICKDRQKRYFLYDVNPGEGFNLRRDVYIRIAPLIFMLNQIDVKNEWILVLPPWGYLPHWKNYNQYFPWSTFFEVEEINKYIPAIELSQYLEDYGYDNPIDMVFQLQHFPFDPVDRTWSEKTEVGAICEEPLVYIKDKRTNDYIGRFWDSKLRSTNATCMSLRGQGSTLAKLLAHSNYSSVMFDRAEVILWDNYGGSDWWKARRSLRFSNKLNKIANEYLYQVLNQSGVINDASNEGGLHKNYNFLAVHLRRQDFVFGRRKLSLPSLPGAAKQVFQIAKRLKLSAVFLATDANFNEFEDFSLAFQILKEDHESRIYLLSLHTAAPPVMMMTPSLKELSEGQMAILDQIICTWSNYFIGTPDSTFTLRIFEEREILYFDSDSTFNYVCPDLPEEEDVFTDTPDCNQPTKWRMKI